MVAQNKKRGKGGARLPVEVGSQRGSDGVNFVLDIPPHRRHCEDPTPVFRPSLEMVGVAIQLLQLSHPFVRVVIPAEEPLVARVRKLQVNEGVGVALGMGS